MGRVELRAFSGLDGSPVRRLPYIGFEWDDSLNEPGSLTATLPESLDARSLCAPYRTVLAGVIDGRVVHAGYVRHLKLSRSSGEWSVDCGGGLTVLTKRLVINHRLASSWKDGSVVVDEDNPSGDWPLMLKGSYSDIVRGLILETLKFGPLPISVKGVEGGSHERNYNSYDLATVYDRIHDITQLEDGIEVRLDPVIGADGRLSFVQRSDVEIVDHHWRWNATLPGSLVTEQDIDMDSDLLCSESYGTGGREDDSLLVARASSGALASKGYPVLQVANTEHSSVSELPTLQSYVAADVACGATEPMTQGFEVDRSLDVRCGDWADVRTSKGTMRMKVTDVKGSASKGTLTVQATERY